MKIIVSNSSRGAFNGVLKELLSKLADGGTCVVLTTDRMTATVERAILEKTSSFGVDVTSFTRLSTKVLVRGAKKCLTPEGSVLLLTTVLQRNKGDLTYYKRARADELAGEIYAAITALRNSGVTTEQLVECADHLPDSLARKTKDLALIYGGYLSALTTREDSTTRLEGLAYAISQGAGDVMNKHFFVIDLANMNCAQLKVLEQLEKHALSVTVGVESGFGYPNKRVYPDRAIAKISSACKCHVEQTPYFEELDDVSDVLGRYLFSYENPPKRVENNGKITVRRALNRKDEVLRLVLDVVSAVRNGARYKDFEVLCGDLDGYSTYLKNTFERYGIPYFIDKKEMLYEQTKVRYVLSALSAVSTNMRQSEVIDFVKNPLFISSLDGEDYLEKENKVFRYENTVLATGINYSGFSKDITLLDEVENAVYGEVKDKLLKALAPLRFAEGNMSAFTSALREIIAAIAPYWNEYVKKLGAVSAYYEKCAEQVDDKLLSLLDEIDGVLGAEDGNVATFADVLKAMLRTLKISLVPTYLDCVFVGDLSSKYSGNGDVYMLGVNSGYIPPDSTGGAIITPDDEDVFESVGVELYPTQKQKIHEEMYCILDVIKKVQSGRRLVLSYSESSQSGLLRPSSIIPQIKALVACDGEDIAEENVRFESYYLDADAEDKLTALLSTPKACFNSLLADVVSGRCALPDVEMLNTAYQFICENDRQRLKRIYDTPEYISNPPECLSTSVSRLESFYKCPYSYYLDYTLHLKQRDKNELDSMQSGTVLHKVLEVFFRALKDDKVEADNAEKIAVDAFDEFVDSDPKLKGLKDNHTAMRALERMKSEAVQTCKDLYSASLRSAFKPTYLEAEFGRGKAFNPISIDLNGKKVELRGKIDRVDTYGDNFIVIDYKTYRGAGLTAGDVYYGNKLQLYIYSEAIVDSLKLKPNGVFYLPVFPSYIKDDEVRYKYKGQVCDDAEMREKIDNLSTLSPKESLVPIAGNALGAQGKYLDQDGFRQRGAYALALAKRGVEDISQGYVAPRPFEGCNNCNAINTCPYRDKFVREKQSVDRSSFETEDNNEQV